MSEYLGFQPTKENDYYFLSYSNADKDRISPIASMLSEKIPIWYDFGIPYGEKWEEEISVKISAAKAVLLFFTRSVLFKEESWVIKEFRISKRINKKIYVVMLDQISIQEVPANRQSFWDDVLEKQNVEVQQAHFTEQIVEVIRAAVSGKAAPVSELPPAPAEPAITEEMLEPQVKIHVEEFRGLRKAQLKAKKAEIRQNNKKQLSEIRDQLKAIVNQPRPDAFAAYQCAKTAMVLVKGQLGAYDWEYKLDRKIEDFEDAYERNLTEIRQAILSGTRNLSDRGIVLAKQVLLGLDEIIGIL